MVKEITYDHDEKGNIFLPSGPPFDGNPVLIKLSAGWCEAWWDTGFATDGPNGPDYKGWCWVCLDDQFQEELDSATHWTPLPGGP